MTIRINQAASIEPTGDEEVGLAAFWIGAVRAPHQPLSVGAEDREAVEGGGGGDTFRLAAAVLVDEEDVELAPARVEHVRRIDDALAVGREERSKVRGAVAGDLLRAGAVGLRDVELHLRGTDEPFREQLLVVLQFGGIRESRRAPDDL